MKYCSRLMMKLFVIAFTLGISLNNDTYQVRLMIKIYHQPIIILKALKKIKIMRNAIVIINKLEIR